MAKFNAKLVKWGNSVGVSIPKPIRDSLGLEAGDDVQISDTTDSILIRKEAPKDTVARARAAMHSGRSKQESEIY